VEKLNVFVNEQFFQRFFVDLNFQKVYVHKVFHTVKYQKPNNQHFYHVLGLKPAHYTERKKGEKQEAGKKRIREK
jgi:ligand-binding sensor domain-containing protein